MRLGQLARKVSVHSSEIVGFLGSKNIIVEEAGNNARISDEHAKLVFERFAPNLLVAPLVEVVEEISEPMLEVTAPVIEELKLESIEPSVEVETDIIQASHEIVDEARGDDELPDLIKASKMELKGLTVLGKIELPGAKKKEISADELAVSELPASELPVPEIVNSPEIPSRPVVPARQKKDFRENRRTSERPRKNPVALKREREEKEAEERRMEEAIRQKEKRTQYYQSRVKPSVPTKAARIIDEPLYHSSETPVRDQPKTIWGKFLRWLTT
jgi:hypothetical protein